MFFKKKAKLSQDEKIALIRQFISSDSTIVQLAKDNNVKEKDLELWYQVYRYGIEQLLNNEGKPRIMPLVEDYKDFPEDTFILFLKINISAHTGHFESLFSNHADAEKFASGYGAMVAQGDETVLLDMREMVLSLCPELSANDVVFAQLKDINISNISNSTTNLDNNETSILPDDGISTPLSGLDEDVWSRGYYAETGDGTWYEVYVTEHIKSIWGDFELSNPDEIEMFANFKEFNVSCFAEFGQITFFVPNSGEGNTLDDLTEIFA